MFLLFNILVLICVGLLAVVVVQPRLIYEYPYFMATAFTVFLLPQAYVIYRNQWGGSYGETALLVCSLCLSCCWLGYRWREHPTLLQKLNVPVDLNRFLHGGIVLLLIGWYCMYKFGGLPEEDLSTQLTGIGTVYLFFGNLVYPGFAIAFYCALKQRRVFAWIMSAFAAIVPLQAALFYGRREPTVLFLLSIALGLYFTKGKTLPRWVIVAAIVIATIGIPATSEYRAKALEDPLAALKEIEFSEVFGESLEAEGAQELKNATALIAATTLTGYYDFGAGYWNTIVFRFVPAQFLGRDFKDSLMIGGERREFGDFIENVLGGAIPTGTTVTGIGDSFNEFGYLGCLVFAVMAYLFKNLWAAANTPNGVVAQILYTQVATSAMHAVTHETVDFIPGFLYGLIFIGAVALYAKQRRPQFIAVRRAGSASQLLSK